MWTNYVESAVFLFTLLTYISQGLITKSCICIFNFQNVMHISIIIIPFGNSLLASPLKFFSSQSLANICFGYEDREWETYLHSSSPLYLFLVSFPQLWRSLKWIGNLLCLVDVNLVNSNVSQHCSNTRIVISTPSFKHYMWPERK